MYLWKCHGCESSHPYPEYKKCPNCGREISANQKELYRRIEFLKSQAELGSLYAAEVLYSLYKQGSQFEPDYSESLRWLGYAAENGSPNAQFELARLYFFENEITYTNKDEAFRWFVRSMNSGFPDAKHYVAYCYLYGEGVTEDPQKGIELLEESAKEGNPESMEMLGRCYKHGIGIEANDEKAFYWLETASEIEDFELSPKAGYELGCYYFFGEVTEENENAASSYMDIAYKDGNQMAGVYLGVIFYNYGHETTISAAKKIWTQVAQSDDADAAERAKNYLKTIEQQG